MMWLVGDMVLSDVGLMDNVRFSDICLLSDESLNGLLGNEDASIPQYSVFDSSVSSAAGGGGGSSIERLL